MTTTFIDPPGQLSNTSEPIDFTTDRLVTSISVEFHPSVGNGAREAVWDGTSDVDNTGGDFSYKYRNSTHSDLTGPGPYTWHIVPVGRWPDDFRIRVKEELAAGAIAFTTLYSVDFRSLPNQSLTATGAVTLDGKTWYAKGSLTSQANSIVNGSGMSWSFPAGGNAPISTAAADYAYRAMFLPFDSLDGYETGSPILIRAHGVPVFSGGIPVNLGVGIISTAKNGSSVLAADRQTEVIAMTGNQTLFASPYYKLGVSSISAGAAYTTYSELAVCRYLGELCTVLRKDGAWSGSFVASNTLDADTGITQPNLKPTRTTPGVVVIMTGQSTTTPAYLTHLEILQPKGV